MNFVFGHEKWQALMSPTDPVSFLPRFLFLFVLPKSYWQTTVTDEGFVSSRPFGPDVRIPWSAINLVDPTGLTELSETSLKFFADNVSKRSAARLKTRRGFYLRLNDMALSRAVCRFTPGKITFCAGDAVGIENISVAEADALKEVLAVICKEK